MQVVAIGKLDVVQMYIISLLGGRVPLKHDIY